MRTRTTIALCKKALSKKPISLSLDVIYLVIALFSRSFKNVNGNMLKKALLSLFSYFCRFANRLTGIKENEKFQKNGRNNEQVPGLKHVVEDAKQRHNVK